MAGDATETRALLESAIEGAAKWRGRKADEYRDDSRNEMSRIALQLAAREVAALPSDDPRLIHLASLPPEVFEHYVAEERRLIARHGFGPGTTPTTGDLLAALVQASYGAADRVGRVERALKRHDESAQGSRRTGA